MRTKERIDCCFCTNFFCLHSSSLSATPPEEDYKITLTFFFTLLVVQDVNADADRISSVYVVWAVVCGNLGALFVVKDAIRAGFALLTQTKTGLLNSEYRRAEPQTPNCFQLS